jgi:hypothetical protein
MTEGKCLRMAPTNENSAVGTRTKASQINESTSQRTNESKRQINSCRIEPTLADAHRVKVSGAGLTTATILALLIVKYDSIKGHKCHPNDIGLTAKYSNAPELNKLGSRRPDHVHQS